MINVIFNDFSYEIAPKKLETYDKYCKILRWGRRHPTRFIEDIIKINLTDHQKMIILNSWLPATVVWLMSRNSGKAELLYTHTPTAVYGDKGVEYSTKFLGDLKVGDYVIGDDGQPTKITHLNPIIIDDVYEVAFSNGTKVECGPEHLWPVYDTVFNRFNPHVETQKLRKYPIKKNDKEYRFQCVGKDGEMVDIVSIRLTGEKKPMRCITVEAENGRYLTGDTVSADNPIYTHNSFLTSPFIMARTLLFPNYNVYIMAPSGGQAQQTFTKLEDTAKGNIASLIGVSSVFLDECVRMNAKADPFTHDKQSYTVTLYNNSSINTLNSVAKTIVGIRSNMNVYDEAGKIERDYFALTEAFTLQNTNFVTGSGINAELYPKQMPNKNIYLSSAEGIDSHLFDMYKRCAERMLLGDPNYYVCDIDCTFSLHPTMNGKPVAPLISQESVDDAFATNPYKAQRELMNRFDRDGGEDVFVKRSTILKYSTTYYPVFENEDGKKKYIIAYDPSTKLDNSMVIIAEIWRDHERGWMAKLVNAVNLIELLPSGDKAVIQTPEQIERIKDLIIDYNRGAIDYDNIDTFFIDAGAGGGGTNIAQFLMKEWKGSDGKIHIGFIDTEDVYMKLRADDYPGNSDKLTMFNFKRDKVQAYERAQMAINQGLLIFPTSLNLRGELEFEEIAEDGTAHMRYEKCNFQETNALVQLDLAKEELIAMQKVKRPNGTVVFDLSPDSKSRNFHDDRADCVAMICNRLMELRIQDALEVEEKPKTEFKEMFNKAKVKTKASQNPLTSRMGSNQNPFAQKRFGGRFG